MGACARVQQRGTSFLRKAGPTALEKSQSQRHHLLGTAAWLQGHVLSTQHRFPMIGTACQSVIAVANTIGLLANARNLLGVS